MADGGRILIRIEPDTTGFAERLRTQLSSITPRPTVHVQLDADVTGFSARIQSRLVALRPTVHVQLDADVTGFSARLQARLALIRPTITVGIDHGGLGSLTQMFNNISNTVSITTGQLTVFGDTITNITNIKGGGGGLAGIFTGALGSVGALASSAMALGRILLALNVIPLIASAGQALGVLALLPAAISSAAGAMATLKLGTSGVADAFSAAETSADEMGQTALDAAHQMQLANEAVEDAQKGVVDAQKDTKDAVEDLNQAYKDQARELRDVNDELKDAELSLEGSAISVARARQRLTETKQQRALGKATDLDVQEADLDVRQAEHRYDTQKKSTADMREDTAEANRKGIAGSDRVKNAKEAVSDAQDAQVKAARTLRDALYEQARAARTAASGVDEYAKALNKLSPNARDFVVKVRSMNDEFKALKTVVQDNLFDDLGDEVVALAKDYLPSLKTGLGDIATSFNTGFKGIIDWLRESRTIGEIQNILTNTAPTVQNLLGGIREIGRAFVTIASVGSNFLPGLSGEFKDSMTRFANWIQGLADSGQLQEFIQGAIDKFWELWEILKDVGGIIAGIFGGSKDTGDDMLTSIGQTLDKWNAFVNSKEGQEKIKQFFEDVKQITADILAALKMIGQVAGVLGRTVGGVTQSHKSGKDYIAEVEERARKANGGEDLFATKAKNWIEDTPGVNILTAIPRYIAESVVGIPQVQKAMEGLGTKLGSIFKSTADTAKSWGKSFGEVFTDIGKRNEAVKEDIVSNWNTLKDWFNNFSFSDSIKHIWDGLKIGFKGVINSIIRWWNSLKFKTPGFDLFGKKIASIEIGVTQIQELKAAGGEVGRRPDGSVYGPGTGTSDDILALTSRGRALAVSDGETVIIEKAGHDPANRAAMRHMNNGGSMRDFVVSQRLSTGGLIGGGTNIDNASDFAKYGKDAWNSEWAYYFEQHGGDTADNRAQVLRNDPRANNAYLAKMLPPGSSARYLLHPDDFATVGEKTFNKEWDAYFKSHGAIGADRRDEYLAANPRQNRMYRNGTLPPTADRAALTKTSDNQTPTPTTKPDGTNGTSTPGATTAGEPYGLAANANSGGYGGTGVDFPAWVDALAAKWNVKPSTYADHQTGEGSGGAAYGYEPNPQGLNRGIDWGGSISAMQAFADYLMSTAPSQKGLEQVIWWNPETGQKAGWAGRRNVTDDGYYNYPQGYPDHRDHVHTRFNASITADGTTPTTPTANTGDGKDQNGANNGTTENQHDNLTNAPGSTNGDSTGTTSTTWSGLAGDVAKAAVSGYVQDTLGVFGISDTMPGIVQAGSLAWSSLLANQNNKNGQQNQNTGQQNQNQNGTGPDQGQQNQQQTPPAAQMATNTSDGSIAAGTPGAKEAVWAEWGKRGWQDSANWDATLRLYNGESGWQVGATNPSSGAYGLGQFLGEDKKQRWPGYFTPDANAQASPLADYIAERYGTPAKAWAFWQDPVGHGADAGLTAGSAGHWYEQGGWLKPGITMALNGTGVPEAILTNPQWKVAESAIGVAKDVAKAAANSPVAQASLTAVLGARDAVSQGVAIAQSLKTSGINAALTAAASARQTAPASSTTNWNLHGADLEQQFRLARLREAADAMAYAGGRA